MILKFYLFFINGYKIIYFDKKNEIGEFVERMNIGLEKLIEVG